MLLMKKGINKGITLMNALLCFCVVMIHLTSSPLSELRPGSLAHISIFIINKLLCFSVPAFIFLSGFKLYSKYGNEKVDIKPFFKKGFRKSLSPTCFVY